MKSRCGEGEGEWWGRACPERYHAASTDPLIFAALRFCLALSTLHTSTRLIAAVKHYTGAVCACACACETLVISLSLAAPLCPARRRARATSSPFSLLRSVRLERSAKKPSEIIETRRRPSRATTSTRTNSTRCLSRVLLLERIRRRPSLSLMREFFFLSPLLEISRISSIVSPASREGERESFLFCRTTLSPVEIAG